jgi:hypothetical protein
VLLFVFLTGTLAVTPVWGTVVDIPATITGHVERSQGGGYRWKFYGNLKYGLDYIRTTYYDNHAFLKFSLDSLPDSCTILSAELNYRQYDHVAAYPSVDIRLIPDPVPLNAANLFSLIDTAMWLTGPRVCPDGWVVWQMGSAAMAALDSCRERAWASFGVRYGGGVGHAHADGYNGENPPYLRIVYADTSDTTDTLPPPLPPRDAVQRTAAKLPDFAFGANPSGSIMVTVRSALAVGKRRVLTMRDVVGRAVRTFAIDPPGIAHIDLRGLAPGVYMATLEAGPQSLTRKLILTAR